MSEQEKTNEDHETRLKYLEGSIDMLYERPLSAHAKRIRKMEKKLKKHIEKMYNLEKENIKLRNAVEDFEDWQNEIATSIMSLEKECRDLRNVNAEMLDWQNDIGGIVHELNRQNQPWYLRHKCSGNDLTEA